MLKLLIEVWRDKTIRKKMYFMQKTKLRMWGNSYAVRLPKALIETIGLKNGSEFQILYNDKQIILKEIE